MLKLFNRVLMAMPRRSSSPLKDYRDISFVRISLLLHRWVKERGYCAPDTDMRAVAHYLGISRDRLSAYCTTVLRKNFLSWRKELRIKEAQRLMIENPEVTVATLADSVGLDRANFRRQFCEVCGCTLQDWKEKHLCNK